MAIRPCDPLCDVEVSGGNRLFAYDVYDDVSEDAISDHFVGEDDDDDDDTDDISLTEARLFDEADDDFQRGRTVLLCTCRRRPKFL